MGLPYFVACNPRLYTLSNNDLETYVYFSQYGHDHYVIKSTVSSTLVFAHGQSLTNLLSRSVLFGEC